jgi:hypothetical protein
LHLGKSDTQARKELFSVRGSRPQNQASHIFILLGFCDVLFTGIGEAPKFETVKFETLKFETLKFETPKLENHRAAWASESGLCSLSLGYLR